MKKKNFMKISIVSLLILFITFTPINLINGSIEGKSNSTDVGYDG